MENNSGIRNFDIGENVITTSKAPDKFKNEKGTIVSLEKNKKSAWRYVVELKDGRKTLCSDSQLLKNVSDNGVEKVVVMFTDQSSEVLNNWLAGNELPFKKGTVSEIIERAYPTTLNYLKKIKAGTEKIEDLVTVNQLKKLVDYRNELAEKPQEIKPLEKQLEEINKVRKMQKLKPLKMEQFQKTFLSEGDEN